MWFWKQRSGRGGGSPVREAGLQGARTRSQAWSRLRLPGPVLEEGLVIRLSPWVWGWCGVTRMVPRGHLRQALLHEPAHADQEACCRAAWVGDYWPMGTGLHQWALKAIRGTLRTLVAAAQFCLWEGNMFFHFLGSIYWSPTLWQALGFTVERHSLCHQGVHRVVGEVNSFLKPNTIHIHFLWIKGFFINMKDYKEDH